MTNQKQNKDVLSGTMGLENSLSQEQERLRYDEAGKKVLRHKEILAIILKYGVPEYGKYSPKEIMDFIENDSISTCEPIAPDTDTRIKGDNTEESSTNEANLTFDVRFRVANPVRRNFHIHFDVELQDDYYPGYPIEKRGIYNLARMISSQLEVVTKKTNYSKLEKACCIFVCVGNVPHYLWNTVSYYEFINTKNIGNIKRKIKSTNEDLMELVIIRIGKVLQEEADDLVHFLHSIFFNMDAVGEYIDFSQNQEFRKELGNMGLLGDHLIEVGRDQERGKVLEARKRAKQAENRAVKAEQENEGLRKRIKELEELQKHQ